MWDPKTKRIVTREKSPSSTGRRDPDEGLTITSSDAIFGSTTEGQIVVSAEILKEAALSSPFHGMFEGRSDESVYVLFRERAAEGKYSGTILCAENPEMVLPESFGREEDRVRVVFAPAQCEATGFKPGKRGAPRGFILFAENWHQVPIQVVPMRDALFSRFGGILETDALAGKRVAIFGLGSGGSQVAIELVKSGIMQFDLVDHDRVEVVNFMRHYCGLPDSGRFKPYAMADRIKEKNPYAEVRKWPLRVDWSVIETVRDIVREADLVLVTTDNQPSRLLLNRVCVQEGKTCIFAGAHRRAHGGQVLRVRPHQSCCYQCFVMMLPEQAKDQEVSNGEQARGIGYTDRPVPIEPGLSIDIAPIFLFSVKLAIQELLQGTQTTLRSLDADLTASWYLWLNRREAGTPYENLEPLGCNIDGLHILRWYGIKIERHPGCPVCGDFAGHFSDEDVASSAGLLESIGRQPSVVE